MKNSCYKQIGSFKTIKLMSFLTTEMSEKTVISREDDSELIISLSRNIKKFSNNSLRIIWNWITLTLVITVSILGFMG